MAKQNSLPSVDDGPPEKPQQRAKQEHAPITDDGYAGRKIDVKMNDQQAVKFKKILRYLEDQGALHSDGVPVSKRRHAVLWMIEQFEL